MPDLSSKQIKHLTREERIEIQDCLFHGVSFKGIARRIGKDPTTVSKEVKKHIQIIPARCDNATPCAKLLKAPFVCNGCREKRCCKLEKHEYLAKPAQAAYEQTLVECRTGIPLSKESFYESDRIIADGIRKGQHLYHIMATNNLSMSKSTVYRDLKRGYLSICSLDMPRVVKFKPRSSHSDCYVPKKLKIGRTFDCFENFVQANGVASWVEMDTVIGRVGGKVIMTFDFTLCNFMFGILLDNKTSSAVAFAIKRLKQALDNAPLPFVKLFPVILTDNGGEFSDVFAIENNIDGVQESHLFFCDPETPSQKPHVEKNHTILRDIVPSGSSFDDFTQKTVNMIFSHVNAIARKSLNGKSPFDVFAFTFGADAALTLGIHHVDVADVIQSPRLLKR
ncbi:MAG: helix-turn-helix domain-containing protein [Clostridia bacterium]